MVALVKVTQGHTHMISVTIFIIQQVQVIKDMENLKKKKKKKKKITNYLRGSRYIRWITFDANIATNLNQIIIVQIFQKMTMIN